MFTECEGCKTQIVLQQSGISFKLLDKSLCHRCMEDELDSIERQADYDQQQLEAQAEAEYMAQAEAQAEFEEYFDAGGY